MECSTAEPWLGSPEVRAAGYLMQAQTTMTSGAIAVMRRDPWLDPESVPRLLTREYDPQRCTDRKEARRPCQHGNEEKQGGSDVRSNTSHAARCPDATYPINGHKWFFSARQCECASRARASRGGLSCFFMPRRLPVGSLNGTHIHRLKDRLGTGSNASSEVEFIVLGRI